MVENAPKPWWSEERRAAVFRRSHRVVVKVGSGLLTTENGLDLKVMEDIASQMAALMRDGRECLLVSSGAVAAGVRKMGLERRPEDIPGKQAAAAAGQADLIMEWERAFEKEGRKVAQVLLTRDDLAHRRRYLNARNALNVLLDWGVLPVINENDTVVVAELKFGDNDNLSAMIAHLMDADVLVNLTDTEGLYTADPRSCAHAQLVDFVECVDESTLGMACKLPGDMGTGGMLSKVKAARKATAAGIPVVVAGGARPGVLRRLFEGHVEGTFFAPRRKKMPSKKCWIGFALKPKGRLVVDDGAAHAVVSKGKSLLPVGVLKVSGCFGVGDSVECAVRSGRVVARGLVNYASGDIDKIKGRNSVEIAGILGRKPYDEVIHRDNLVIMEPAREV